MLSVTSATAQTPAIPRDAATDDQLDPMLAGRDWKGLESILMRPADRATTAKHLNWMNRQVRGGGNFFLAQIYAGRLWMAGQGDAGLRQDASEMLLYALALVQVDGAVCEDRTAPERRLRQVLDWQAPVLRAARALPPARMAQLARAAQALESVTASRRMERDETLNPVPGWRGGSAGRAVVRECGDSSDADAGTGGGKACCDAQAGGRFAAARLEAVLPAAAGL